MLGSRLLVQALTQYAPERRVTDGYTARVAAELEDRISALDQDDPNARSMNAAYALMRDAELRRYRWGFATKRESTPADATDALWGDWKRYTLPNDYLMLIRDDETGQAPDWRIEGLYIVTADASPLEIRYVARIDGPNLYDALFI